MRLVRSIFFVIYIFSFIDCSDITTPKKEDLSKYPEIRMFTPGLIYFKGIEHNLDLGTYSFYFRSYHSVDSLFKYTDQNATKNGWIILKKEIFNRKYMKRSTIYQAADGFDVISLEYNSRDKRIRLTSRGNIDLRSVNN